MLNLRLASGLVPLLVLVAAQAGCASAGKDLPSQPAVTSSLDRPEPVTGSMLNRDRKRSDARMLDPSAVQDGARGTTGSRPAAAGDG
jgi:hypothetical protein